MNTMGEETTLREAGTLEFESADGSGAVTLAGVFIVGIEVKDGRGIEGDRGRGGGERRRKPCGSEGRGERKRRT